MKRTNHILNGIVAVAAIILFAQCSGKKENPTVETSFSNGEVTSSTNLKIAYVDIDTLLLNYHFWQDVTEEMMKREENIRATLTQKGRELEKDAQEFQRKVENNAFVSQDRAQQEYNRIGRKEQDLQALQTRLTTELGNENAKNGLILRDSINSFLKDYNKAKGYSMILTNTGFDNLLYADPILNITQEIVDGLNSRYNPSGTKK